MDDLLNKIADELIASGAWLDADPALAGTKRVIKHAVDANFYVLLERVVSANAQNNYYFRLNEVKVTVASDWNLGTHLPAGTQDVTSIPAEFWQRYQENYGFYTSDEVGSGNKTGQYWMWVDANGVSLLATWTPSVRYDYTTFFHLERNAQKEYADGFTNFFLMSLPNEDRDMNVPSQTSRVFDLRATPPYYDYGRKEYIRPFNQGTHAYADGIATFFDAYKSAGNSKVYFQFPYYSNNLDPVRRTPIAQTNRWLRLGIGLGIADGDLIDWVNGAEVWKFLAKTLQSPDSTSYLPIAIRYA